MDLPDLLRYQNKLLRELLKLAQQVWVTVTLEEKVSVAQLKRPQHLFRMSGEMMESLTRMAAEERVEVLDPWWVRPGENSRFWQGTGTGISGTASVSI